MKRKMDPDEGIAMDTDDDVSSAKKMKEIDGEQPDLSNESNNNNEQNNETAAQHSGQASLEEVACDDGPHIPVNIVWGKKHFALTVSTASTVQGLKTLVQTVAGVPPAMQKLMYKGLMKDEQTLDQLKVQPNAKIVLIGSTIDDIVTVNEKPKGDKEKMDDSPSAAASTEPLSKQKQHTKIIDKGVPEDAMPGVKNAKYDLPAYPLSGMCNKFGGKVRLTFKLESDEVWIGTKERTEKIPMNQIRAIISEPIVGHDEYHIMAIQLGPTEASRYWVYWVPCQYVDAIKRMILGG